MSSGPGCACGTTCTADSAAFRHVDHPASRSRRHRQHHDSACTTGARPLTLHAYGSGPCGLPVPLLAWSSSRPLCMATAHRRCALSTAVSSTGAGMAASTTAAGRPSAGPSSASVRTAADVTSSIAAPGSIGRPATTWSHRNASLVFLRSRAILHGNLAEMCLFHSRVTRARPPAHPLDRRLLTKSCKMKLGHAHCQSPFMTAQRAS